MNIKRLQNATAPATVEREREREIKARIRQLTDEVGRKRPKTCPDFSGLEDLPTTTSVSNKKSTPNNSYWSDKISTSFLIRVACISLVCWLPLLRGVGVCFFILVGLAGAFSQNVGVNATGSTPNISAGLDVDFNNKGLLIPRIALTGTGDVTTIATPATSLLVYNTATISDVTPSFYYWDGAMWVSLSTRKKDSHCFTCDGF